MASKNTAEYLNFQYYVDKVKQKKIPWSVFMKLMEDLSYSDVNRLKYLNAILLTEVTVSYSDIERLKYLSVILMAKFKDFIQADDDEVSENENLEVAYDLNDKTIKEISSDRKNEKQGKKFIQIEDDVELCENKDCEVSHKSTVDHDKNDQTMMDIFITRENEEHENFDSPIIKNNKQQNLDSQINEERIFESTHTTLNGG